MELHGLFVESESDDYVARMSAAVVHKQIAYWLQANEDRLARRMINTGDGGFILRTSDFDMDGDYPDLLIAFMPENREAVAAGFASKAGFALAKPNAEGILAGKKLIILRCLKAPHDTEHLADRFRVGFKQSFIHEFQHYLMSSRKKGAPKSSSDAMRDGGVVAYFNDADETNAYYQEAVHDVEDFFNTVRREHPQSLAQFSDMTTLELIAWVKKQFFDKNFLEHASPKTTQALNKRLYRFLEQTVRPMFATVLKNFQP